MNSKIDISLAKCKDALLTLMTEEQKKHIVKIKESASNVEISLKFENGYGALVNGHKSAFDSVPNLYEVSILDQNGNIAYETNGINGIVWDNSPEDAYKTINKIMALDMVKPKIAEHMNETESDMRMDALEKKPKFQVKKSFEQRRDALLAKMTDEQKRCIAELCEYMGGLALSLKFPNGFGASVVSHRGSYGGDCGMYEVAVLDQNGEMTYDTEITCDVIGYLTPEEASEVMNQIMDLSIENVKSAEDLSIVENKGKDDFSLDK